MIRLQQLSKTFIKDGSRIEVLKGLDLEIRKGESLAVVGVSGSNANAASGARFGMTTLNRFAPMSTVCSTPRKSL